ncbi:leucyl aminopeptidase [Bacillus mesophilus]|uniref:Uncharacterized protein n=1 Tax=Bacillus mesophilus TaxID=1808955 RepID=A0A6M0QA28_9BACI|nr:hypothetical protein [Bacillus mesophilus]MBM7661708.1 leucyl aminopeptidase [Bacillus mesophilus]NEY72370.1 hypothetical protein [Bacillus mesophilus]
MIYRIIGYIQCILIWFVQKAWPVILTFLVKYADEIISVIINVVTRNYNEKQKLKVKSEEERKEYEFKSDFFKEQAEECAEEIMKMAEIFENVTRKTKEMVNEKTKEFKPEDIFKIGENEFEFKENKTYLKLEETK